jgi:hypothetical protein
MRFVRSSESDTKSTDNAEATSFSVNRSRRIVALSFPSTSLLRRARFALYENTFLADPAAPHTKPLNQTAF